MRGEGGIDIGDKSPGRARAQRTPKSSRGGHGSEVVAVEEVVAWAAPLPNPLGLSGLAGREEKGRVMLASRVP